MAPTTTTAKGSGVGAAAACDPLLVDARKVLRMLAHVMLPSFSHILLFF